jgi:tetratricopeptide (TPR) repeat protein
LLWAFLYGVGLANHHTLVLLAPGFLAQGIGSCREPGLSPLQNLTKAARLLGRRLPAWSLFFLLGFSLYLYLPLRAAQHPPVNFGDPHTGPRFWNVLTRKEFGRLDLHPAAVPFRTQDLLWRQTNTFFRQNVHVLGGLALVLGLWGLVLSRRLSWLLFWLFSGPLFYVYSNLSPFNSLAQWRLERFLLLPSLMLPVGVAAFLGKWRTKKAKALAAILAIGLLAEPFILAGRPWHRWNLAFQDFGRNLTASLAPQSTLLIDRVLFDEPTSCLLHRLAVERQRPDLRVVYRPGTLFGLFYGEDLLELSWDKRLERQAQQERPLWDQSGPLAALAFVRENLPPFPFQLNGLLYHRGASPVPLPPFYIRRDREAGFPRDYPTALILIHYAYFQAKTAFEAKDFEGMRRWAGYASQRGGNMEWLQSNVGSLWSQWARAQESKEAGDSSVLAEAAFRRAVLLDPFFAPGQYGLGYARLQEKRYEEAARCFAEAARLRPEWAEAYYMLGLTFVVAGTPDRAREPWERFLQMDAGSPLAQDVRETLRRK